VLDPTSDALTSSLKQFLFQPVSYDTRLLVYYSGHGWTDGKKTGYLVPVDAPKEDADGFLASLVSMDEIKGWSFQSRAKHALFVFDSCFSGIVFSSRSNTRPSALFLNDAVRKVRFFITAGTEDEQVPAKSDFTPYLIKGLQGEADPWQTGVISGNTLGSWLKLAVSQLGKQTPQYGTAPEVEWQKGDVLFRPAGRPVSNSPVTVAAQTKQIPYQAPTTGLASNPVVRSAGEPEGDRAKIFAGPEKL